MSSLPRVTDQSFDDEVLKSDLPVTVEFSAEWSGSCKSLALTLEDLVTEYAGRVKFVQVDIDESRQTRTSIGILAVPTLVFFKDGEVVDKVNGVEPKAALSRRLDKLINKVVSEEPVQARPAVTDDELHCKSCGSVESVDSVEVWAGFREAFSERLGIPLSQLVLADHPVRKGLRIARVPLCDRCYAKFFRVRPHMPDTFSDPANLCDQETGGTESRDSRHMMKAYEDESNE